jgi:hypothetical protein
MPAEHLRAHAGGREGGRHLTPIVLFSLYLALLTPSASYVECRWLL